MPGGVKEGGVRGHESAGWPFTGEVPSPDDHGVIITAARNVIGRAEMFTELFSALDLYLCVNAAQNGAAAA
jgi:hypothetical protein